jgi:hypothetical protein
MIGRVVWFTAGAAAGAYGTVKARRAAYRLSGPGIIDQAAALGVGWRAFSADLREGMREREDAVVTRLDPAAALGAPPAGTLDSASGGLQLVTPEDETG